MSYFKSCHSPHEQAQAMSACWIMIVILFILFSSFIFLLIDKIFL